MDHLNTTTTYGRININIVSIDRGESTHSDYLLLNFSFIVVVVQLDIHFLYCDLSLSYDSFIENDGPWPSFRSPLCQQRSTVRAEEAFRRAREAFCQFKLVKLSEAITQAGIRLAVWTRVGHIV